MSQVSYGTITITDMPSSSSTSQHFWFNPTDQGTLLAGAYITNTDIDTFKVNRIGGYVFIKSDKIEMGNGTNKYMVFNTDSFVFYHPKQETNNGVINYIQGSKGIEITPSRIDIYNNNNNVGATIDSDGFFTLNSFEVTNDTHQRETVYASISQNGIKLGTRYQGISTNYRFDITPSNGLSYGYSNTDLFKITNQSQVQIYSGTIGSTTRLTAQFDENGLTLYDYLIEGNQVTQYTLATLTKNLLQIGSNRANNTRALIQSSGMQIITKDDENVDNLIAHLGYGPGIDENGETSTAPYYSLGVRIGNSVGNYSYIEGKNNVASAYCSHAEGFNTQALGSASHTEGIKTQASYVGSHAEGYNTVATGGSSPGIETPQPAHAEGNNTLASSNGSHSEGIYSQAINLGAHAEGYGTSSYYIKASGEGAHAEGYANLNNIEATGKGAHAEGYSDGVGNLGRKNLASGNGSHAEGSSTLASGNYSHAEGRYTTASSIGTHAEGYNSTASGSYSHAEGYLTQAIGDYSHCAGQGTIANNLVQCSIGSYNEDSTGVNIPAGYGKSGYDQTVFSNPLFIVGNGASLTERTNALTLDWFGNLKISGAYQDNTFTLLSSPVKSTTFTNNDTTHYRLNGVAGTHYFYVKMGLFVFVTYNIYCVSATRWPSEMSFKGLPAPLLNGADAVMSCLGSENTGSDSMIAAIQSNGTVQCTGGTTGRYYYGTCVYIAAS